MNNVDLFLLVIITIMTLATVMASGLLRAALGLAVVSAVLSALIYRIGAPIAAVYELSVCAGLIPVIFITVISLTKPLKKDEEKQESIDKIHRFWPLPILIVLIGAGMFLFKPVIELKQFMVVYGPDVKEMVWSIRQTDLIGQIAILLAGAFAILILFKEMRSK